jgi:O-glycosyl hydrolase
MKKNRWKKIAAVAAAGAVTWSSVFGGVSTGRVSAADAQEVTVDSSKIFASNDGIFEGWGTSLCWFGNRIGGSEKTTQEAAKLLCNQEDGLGLNIIRFNIGGGDDPSHNHITRTDSKMPGYWGEYDAASDTFTYDFTKDANQRNVLLKMLEENPNLTLEAFSNSAPYFMTNSGCTSGTETSKDGDNLKEDKYDAFAEYLATVVENYKSLYGVNFTSIEPINENGWSIERNGAKQEGCSFSNSSQSKMITALNDALNNHNLQNLILAGLDQSSPSETVSCLNAMTSDALNALERIDTHTYTNSVSSETQLRDQAASLGKNLWMSEVDGKGKAGKNAGEMSAALYFAKMISYDMANLQPSAWIMWQAIASYYGQEAFDGNYDNTPLDQQSLDTEGFWGVTYADMDQEKVVLTKKYYGFAQYTKYIHAGDYMLQGDKSNTISYDAANKELKIVTYNTKEEEVENQYHLEGFQVSDGTVNVVRTSGDLETGENLASLDDLKADNNGFSATLAPNSITTFIVKGITGEGLEERPQVTDTSQTSPSESASNETQDAQDTLPTPVQDQGQTPSVSQESLVENTQSENIKQVTGVKVSNIKKNQAKISWKKAAGAKSYLVAYSTKKSKLAKQKKDSSQAVSGVKIKKVSKNNVTLTGLQKKTKYYIKVFAVSDAGCGESSSVKNFTTKKK